MCRSIEGLHKLCTSEIFYQLDQKHKCADRKMQAQVYGNEVSHHKQYILLIRDFSKLPKLVIMPILASEALLRENKKIK